MESLPPLQRAQALDSQAETEEQQGKFTQAIITRTSAAQAYKLASASISDPSARRTLALLGEKQLSLCVDLQRRANSKSAKPRPNDRTGQLVPRPKSSVPHRSIDSLLSSLLAPANR